MFVKIVRIASPFLFLSGILTNGKVAKSDVTTYVASTGVSADIIEGAIGNTSYSQTAYGNMYISKFDPTLGTIRAS